MSYSRKNHNDQQDTLHTRLIKRIQKKEKNINESLPSFEEFDKAKILYDDKTENAKIFFSSTNNKSKYENGIFDDEKKYVSIPQKTFEDSFYNREILLQPENKRLINIKNEIFNETYKLLGIKKDDNIVSKQHSATFVPEILTQNNKQVESESINDTKNISNNNDFSNKEANDTIKLINNAVNKIDNIQPPINSKSEFKEPINISQTVPPAINNYQSQVSNINKDIKEMNENTQKVFSYDEIIQKPCDPSIAVFKESAPEIINQIFGNENLKDTKWAKTKEFVKEFNSQLYAENVNNIPGIVDIDNAIKVNLNDKFYLDKEELSKLKNEQQRQFKSIINEYYDVLEFQQNKALKDTFNKINEKQAVILDNTNNIKKQESQNEINLKTIDNNIKLKNEISSLSKELLKKPQEPILKPKMSNLELEDSLILLTPQNENNSNNNQFNTINTNEIDKDYNRLLNLINKVNSIDNNQLEKLEINELNNISDIEKKINDQIYSTEQLASKLNSVDDLKNLNNLQDDNLEIAQTLLNQINTDIKEFNNSSNIVHNSQNFVDLNHNDINEAKNNINKDININTQLFLNNNENNNLNNKFNINNQQQFNSSSSLFDNDLLKNSSNHQLNNFDLNSNQVSHQTNNALNQKDNHSTLNSNNFVSNHQLDQSSILNKSNQQYINHQNSINNHQLNNFDLNSNQVSHQTNNALNQKTNDRFNISNIFNNNLNQINNTLNKDNNLNQNYEQSIKSSFNNNLNNRSSFGIYQQNQQNTNINNSNTILNDKVSELRNKLNLSTNSNNYLNNDEYIKQIKLNEVNQLQNQIHQSLNNLNQTAVNNNLYQNQSEISSKLVVDDPAKTRARVILNTLRKSRSLSLSPARPHNSEIVNNSLGNITRNINNPNYNQLDNELSSGNQLFNNNSQQVMPLSEAMKIKKRPY